MNKLNKILSVVVLILAVMLVLVFWKPSFLTKFTSPCYYAVYLTSGDLYFGRLSWFNQNTLTDVRMIQRQQASEDEEPVVSLVEFNKSVIWGPVESLKLNRKNILWISKLSNDSQIMQVINKK